METPNDQLKPLLDKLEKTRFTGELRLRFESGQPPSATLIHLLAISEFRAALPTLEEEKEFSLSP